MRQGLPADFRVSIHASAREATRRAGKPAARRSGFNPRLRAGGDTTHNGAYSSRTGFNPRLRAGGDAGFSLPDPFTWEVSIHASAREATTGRVRDIG